MSTKAVRKIEVKEAKKVRKFAMPVYLNIILLALGICLLIWADKVTTMISIVIGATFLVCAAYNFIAYYRIENRTIGDNTKLVSAIALAIAGGFLIIQSGFIKEVISVFIGVFLLIESIFRMQDILASKAYNPNYKSTLILSLIGVICGALCVFGKIIVPNFLLQLLGAMLIVFAFVDMTGGIMVSKSSKTAAKTVHAKVIDEEK
jgi:uncharacterized membrane protein HdeD (DUF308 family)